MDFQPTPPPVQLQPGQQPTQQQLETIQEHMRQDAARMGITFEEYVGKIREMAMAQQRAAMENHVHGPECNHGHQHDHGHQHQEGTNEAVQPGPPKPEAVALANFLKNQDLKVRTCIFQEKRQDMFRVKRALRVLQSPAYEKARKKSPFMPPVTDRESAEAAFKLLPLSLLALRVQKVEEEEEGHEGHAHAKKKKRVKGLWNVQIVQQQDCGDDMYYMWLYEGPQWRKRVYSLAALVGVMIFVMFPLWPLKLRQGAWYLSMAFFALIVLFFAMAIVRLILFCITMFTHPPGLWLFPNLFEDVGFVDSFIPLWAWQEDKKAVRKAKRLERERKKAAKEAKANGDSSPATAGDTNTTSEAVTTGTDAQSSSVAQRVQHASVEEADDE